MFIRKEVNFFKENTINLFYNEIVNHKKGVFSHEIR